MYRNTTVGSLPHGLSRRLLAQCFASLYVCLMAVCATALFGGRSLEAQTIGSGGIQGTITDASGAVVAKAQVTATNTDTGVAFTRQTTSSGLYTITPLPVGTYNVEVVAKGFQRQLQENVSIDATSMLGLNIKLTVGGQNETVTVTDAPPYINTTSASLGGTIENELYSQLPLTMNGGPRDPTAFQYLMPGVQENPGNNTNQGVTAGVSGIYGGSGQTNLNENYVEGMPVNSVGDNQQGSGTQVAYAVSVDAVNQFSVQTNGASVSFGGVGVTNYTINSGGNQFHGTVFDFVRNTAFDTWGYFGKVPNSTTGAAIKPGEHQNSYGGSMGGPIIKDKLFFFGSYEGYRYTKISNTPVYITIPTMAERRGDFTDVLGSTVTQMADPTNSVNGSRPPFTGNLNGVPTLNVIPTNEISSISNYLQSALPVPTNASTFNNYLASLPLANNDYSIDVKIDYTMNARNKFSLVGLGGVVGYGGAPNYNSYNQLPIPYAAGVFTTSKTATGILTYTYIASQSLVNTLKYGYTRSWGEGFSLTQGKTLPNMMASTNPACNGNANSCAAGITNLPPGNASASMPTVTFSDDASPVTSASKWNSKPNSGPGATNTFTLLDELSWIKGHHNVTFGIQAQWLETNLGGYGGYSNVLNLTASATDTQNAIPNTVGIPGDSYASFLIGAIEKSSVGTQIIQDVGGRYRPISPYISDQWQASGKLTINLGLRYDYLQPYHEVKDRIAFLDPTTINPIVGIPGVLEFAGFPNINNFTATTTSTAAEEYANYSPYMCHCTTPVHPYNFNFEPHLGFEYAYTPSTVISAGFSVALTHSGGVGGGNGATAATGNNGEFSANTSYSQSGSIGNPAFFLNPNFFPATASPPAVIDPPNQGTQGLPPAGQTLGSPLKCYSNGPNGSATCNTNPFAAIPSWTEPGQNVNPLSTTGNYAFNTATIGNFSNPLFENLFNCSASGNSCTPQNVNYADPYYGGRGPQNVNWNVSIQKMINKKAVLVIAYAGSETHFLPGGAGRGYAQNTISPDYGLEYEGALSNNGHAGKNPPYPNYSGPNATVEQSLKAFPQFGNFTDIWGDTGNSNSNALEISATQRPWHNLSGFVNYTRMKEIDNTGNHRTQYGLGPQDGDFPNAMSANRVDRSIGQNNQTNAFNLTWVYTFPIGRGQAFFATNRLMSAIGSGWELSGIYKYRDGYPLQVTEPGGSCNAASNAGQGTCMPDYVPGFNKRQARINGRWGRGPGANAVNFNNIPYLNSNAFMCPDSSSTNTTETCNGGTEQTYKIGNIAARAPDGLTGPGWWDIDMGLRRTFNVRETATLHLTFQIEADVTNATNSTFFNLSSSTWNSPAYGEVGSQNQSIPPRDWQFAGRFRF